MPNLRASIGWANIEPTSGSGNGRVAASTTAPYTGRVQRSLSVAFTATGIATPVTRVVKQAAKPEFVDLQTNASVDKAGGSLTLTGTSNSSKLTFAVTPGADNPLALALPATYTVNGASVNNGAAIQGDPGANAEYSFSLVFAGIPANLTINDLTASVTVTSEGGRTDTCPVTQTAGDPMLSVSPAEITIPADGSAVYFDVTCNTDWQAKAAGA